MSARIDAIATELAGSHPVSGAYNADDALAAAQLNEVNVTRIKSSMSGDEIFAATNGTEFGALSDSMKSQWLAFCGRETIDPGGAANVAFVQYIFGAGSTTLSSLASARQETVSQATVIGVGQVRTYDVTEARAA